MNDTFKVTLLLLVFPFFINQVDAKNSTESYNYKYLGNSASNDDRHGWFNETQGIANGDPRSGDPYWFFSKNINSNRNTYIYKVPYTQHLGHNFEYSKRRIRLSGGSKVCEHIGDIDYYSYKNEGYIVAPYDNCGDGHARIAIFKTKDFNGSENVLQPWAVMDVSTVQGDGAPWVSVAPNGKIYSSAGSNKRSDMVFEYTIKWERVKNERQAKFTSRSFRLYDQQGKSLSLTYKQGADFSSDGKRLFITTGYEKNISKTIWVLVRRNDRFVLEHRSNNKAMPFKFETSYNSTASWRQEPQGVSYFDMSRVRPYHKEMQRGQLHVVLLNNKISKDDSVWIKHYQEFKTTRDQLTSQGPIRLKDFIKPKKKRGYSEIIHIKGRCLDVAGGKSRNGTNIQIYACNGSKSQKWRLTKKKEFRNEMGLCLDVKGGVDADGTNIQLYQCNGSKSQQWRHLTRKRIQNVMGRCLDIVNGINENKTNVQLYRCKNTTAQQWKR
ncbi:MAG: ricin-type beta-trefoil lectin domain protein [Kangiellaceae bacterium]|nr:ricin-type beta-trefoil lectin domain protein [Kangiellaceae bacterium]